MWARLVAVTFVFREPHPLPFPSRRFISSRPPFFISGGALQVRRFVGSRSDLFSSLLFDQFISFDSFVSLFVQFDSAVFTFVPIVLGSEEDLLFSKFLASEIYGFRSVFFIDLRPDLCLLELILGICAATPFFSMVFCLCCRRVFLPPSLCPPFYLPLSQSFFAAAHTAC